MSTEKETNNIRDSSTCTTSSNEVSSEVPSASEISFLKDQVTRLNKELSSYQINSNVNPPENHGIELPEYITNVKQLSPLLLAYDCRIEELSAFVERQGSVLDALTQRSNDLLSENENLRSRLIPSICSKTDRVLDTVVHHKDSKSELKQLRSDKHLLEEQAELLVKELKESNQTIGSRDKSISSLSSEVSDKLKVIKRLTENITQSRKQNMDIEEELLAQAESLGRERSQRKTLEEKIKRLQNERDEMNSKVQGVAMDKQYLDKENKTLTEKITQSAIFIQDLQNQLSKGINQYETLNVNHLQLTKEHQKVQHNLEQCTQSKIDLMLRSNNSNEKAKELEQSKREQGTKLRELELNYAKLEAKCNVLQNEVNRIMLEKNENEESRENASWRIEPSEHLKRRDQLIHSLKKKNTELEIQAEKHRQESDLNRSSQQTMERSLKKERMSIRNEIENIHKEVANRDDQLKVEKLQINELSNTCSSLRRELGILQGSLHTNNKEIERLREDDKRKSQDYAISKMNLQRKIDELNSKSAKEASKLKEEKDTLSSQLEEVINKNEGDSKAIQCKMDHLEKSLKDSTQSNQNLRNQMKTQVKQSIEIERKLKVQLHEKITGMQDLMDEHIEENNDLLSNLRRVSEQKQKMDVMLKKSNSEIYVRERKLLDTEGKVSLLSKQLYDNLSDQSEKVAEIKRLKMELSQLKMAKVQE